MIKRFSSSPLPFRGSKRYYVRRFREVLAQTQDIDTVVDLFGGSGLLSRVAKDTLPNCRVIYNDFDHYDTRLANAVNTNALLRSIAPLLANTRQQESPRRDENKDTGAVCRGREDTCGRLYHAFWLSFVFGKQGAKL